MAAEPGSTSAGNHGSVSRMRKDLAITGLAGPSQGSANALQNQQRDAKHVAIMTTAVHHARGITVTPPEVGAWSRGCLQSVMTSDDSWGRVVWCLAGGFDVAVGAVHKFYDKTVARMI